VKPVKLDFLTYPLVALPEESLVKMGYDESVDVEKRAGSNAGDGLVVHHGKLMAEDGAVPGDTFVIGDSWYAKTQRLAGKFKIEMRGIERVPEDERDDKGFKALLNVATMVSCAS
jgi:hypothetical protein